MNIKLYRVSMSKIWCSNWEPHWQFFHTAPGCSDPNFHHCPLIFSPDAQYLWPNILIDGSFIFMCQKFNNSSLFDVLWHNWEWIIHAAPSTTQIITFTKPYCMAKWSSRNNEHVGTSTASRSHRLREILARRHCLTNNLLHISVKVKVKFFLSMPWRC
jgi:hypothetical protein